MNELSEVWCAKCDQPATAEIRLTTGETTARCASHAWLLRAPGHQPHVIVPVGGHSARSWCKTHETYADKESK